MRRTLDTPRTLLHACPSCVLLKKKKKKKMQDIARTEEMEVLSKILKKTEENNLIRGFHVRAVNSVWEQ